LKYNNGIFGIHSDKEMISVSRYFDKLLSHTRFISGLNKRAELCHTFITLLSYRSLLLLFYIYYIAAKQDANGTAHTSQGVSIKQFLAAIPRVMRTN
jgi:hypothetical protein